MNQTRNDRLARTLLVVAAVVLTLSALWLSLASPAQLAQASRVIFVGCAVLTIFMAGAVVGGLVGRRTGGGLAGGDDWPGEPPPPVPDLGFDPDAVEEELQRLIDEDRSQLNWPTTPGVDPPDAALGGVSPARGQATA